MCTGNSCRSQMAEGFVKALRGEEIEAWSAGVSPREIDPRAIRAMAEAGIDISGRSAKDVKDLMDVPFDYVITLCGHAEETCPVFAGQVKVLHKGFDDPRRLAATSQTEDEAMAHYRRVREEIREFVQKLPENLKDYGEVFKLDI